MMGGLLAICWMRLSTSLPPLIQPLWLEWRWATMWTWLAEPGCRGRVPEPVETETLGAPLTLRVRSKLASAAKAVAAAKVSSAAVEARTFIVMGVSFSRLLGDLMRCALALMTNCEK